MISFDDRISSFIIVIIAERRANKRKGGKEGGSGIKYIMIFISKHDSFNKHLWNMSPCETSHCRRFWIFNI